MTRLGAQLGLKADVYKYEPSTELILPKCRIGAEFEFEKVRSEPPLDQEWYGYWEMKRDGSLHDNGMEFVFGRPLFGQDVISAIHGLCGWASGKKYAVSKRTGLHIHVDVRDLTTVELARLTVLYALFEKMIYRFVGNDRDDNVFCLPWYTADKVTLTVNHILNPTKGDMKAKAALLAEEKYAGLNLDSLARFGSVEFRHALATTDLTWVIRWINVCLSFKKAAVELTEDPIAMLHRLSRNGVDILAREVFGPLYPFLWYADMDHDVWTSGIETALAVCPAVVVERKLDKDKLTWYTKQPPTTSAPNPGFLARMEDRKGKKDDPPVKRGATVSTARVPLDAAARWDEAMLARIATAERNTRRDPVLRRPPAVMIVDEVGTENVVTDEDLRDDADEDDDHF